MTFRFSASLACLLITCSSLATELPPAFKKQSTARVAAMCAACMTLSAATMSGAKKDNDKEIDVAVLLYRVWLDRAERLSANEADIRWALDRLKKQPNKVTLLQIDYCVSRGHQHFEALPAEKRQALMSDIEEDKARLLNP